MRCTWRRTAAVVRVLVQTPLVAHIDKNYWRRTPLLEAAWHGRADVVAELLRVEGVAAAEAKQNSLSNTALFIAVRRGHTRCAELLLPVTNWRLRDACSNDTLLHEAAHSAGCLRLLLAAGASANARGAFNRTPLHCAAMASTDGPARVLLAAGADVEAEDSTRCTPLCVHPGRGGREAARRRVPLARRRAL
jgi:ankyrin repeat protein